MEKYFVEFEFGSQSGFHLLYDYKVEIDWIGLYQ